MQYITQMRYAICVLRVACRSKNERLAEYNIHELVQGKASAAQRQLLYGCYDRANMLAASIEDLKSSLMQT